VVVVASFPAIKEYGLVKLSNRLAKQVKPPEYVMRIVGEVVNWEEA
jgi:hypothetical protein